MKENEKGITLIALIITVIIMLILAGIVINLAIGDNGIIQQSQRSATETKKAQVKEDIELKILEVELKNYGTLNKDIILEAINTLDGILAEKDGDIIEGEYKEYYFEIDENNQVIVGDKLSGAKPTGSVEILTKEDEVEEVEIRVTGRIEEGTITSIVAMNGAELKTDESANSKIFKVKDNKEFRFKIVGSNGRSTRVSCEVTNVFISKDKIKKELEQKIAEKGKIEELSKDEILNAIKELDRMIADKEGNKIEGEYKDYPFEIDANNQIIVGEKLYGARPTGEAEILTTEAGATEVEIRVTGRIEEGTITAITAVNGAVLKTDEGAGSKVFKVTDNGTYQFKITGSNRRVTRVSCEVTNMVMTKADIYTAISEMNTSGIQKVRVIGNQNTEIYSFNVIHHKGDLIIGDTLKTKNASGSLVDVTIDGLTKTGTTWYAGKADDVNTRTVILKVDGNLTLSSGYTLSPISSNSIACLGLMVWSEGEITNEGTISGSGVTTTAASQNLYLFKNSNGTFVSASGTTSGGANKTQSGGWDLNSRRGSGYLLVACGGGGGGGASAGAWSNGSTRGGNGSVWSSGKGGNATSSKGSGTGGKGATMILLCSKSFSGTGSVQSNGANGTTFSSGGSYIACSAGGGGGGIVWSFSREDNVCPYTISANSGSGIYASGNRRQAQGGNGGAGSIIKYKIVDGTAIEY